MKKILAGLAFALASLSCLAAPFVINNVQITGGTITGLSSPLPIASGGTNAATASAALSSLGAMPLAGGTFTGNVVMQYPSVATQRQLAWFSATNARWSFQNDGSAESGGNAGSNFSLSSYNDAGSFLAVPITVTRATGLVTLSNGLSPNTLAGIIGTTTNDSANAGSVGEYPTPASTLTTAITTNTATNCTSKSLLPGDWDVQAVVGFTPAPTTTVSRTQAAVSTTSGAFSGGFGSYTSNAIGVPGAGPAINSYVVTTSPVVRVSLASTTTVYAIGLANFATSTMTCDGFLRARRVR